MSEPSRKPNMISRIVTAKWPQKDGVTISDWSATTTSDSGGSTMSETTPSFGSSSHSPSTRTVMATLAPR
jgi:hypothetical protein